jgi:hypothetical protein
VPTLTTLLLATPLFGLSLTPPTLGAPSTTIDFAASLPMPGLLQVSDLTPEERGETGHIDDSTPEERGETSAIAPDAAAQAEADRRYTQEVMQRRELGQIHRALGIATWIAMTGNLIIGMMQYSDRYGFGAGQDHNPCATGQGLIFNECYGTPWAHVISATATSVLYGGTFLLSLVMPDPNQASEGNGAFAEHLRIHEVLRWIHSLGMLAQIVIGAMLSNGVFGDRANNYGTMEAVAAVHQTIGWVTWGALTGAAAVMLF